MGVEDINSLVDFHTAVSPAICVRFVSDAHSWIGTLDQFGPSRHC